MTHFRFYPTLTLSMAALVSGCGGHSGKPNGPVAVCLTSIAAKCPSPKRPDIPFAISNALFNPLDRASTERVAAQASALNQFSFEMFQKLQQTGSISEKENFLFSPLSIRTAFAMLYSAPEANSETQKELANVFHYEDDESTHHREVKSQILSIQDSFSTPVEKKTLELALVNQVFLDKTIDIQPSYLDTLKINYNLGVGKLDFQSSERASEESRHAINGFVSEKTKYLLNDLLPEGSINQATALVLINTIHMLANWNTPFKKEFTSDQTFTTAKGVSIAAKTMKQREWLGYGDYADMNLQAISIPYAGNTVAMLWLVPKQGTDIESIESTLSADRFATILNGLNKTEVNLEIPRFALEWGSTSLKNALVTMGVNIMFDCESGMGHFPRMAIKTEGTPSTAQLCVRDALHKAKISVDEEGTEAAAATAIIVAEPGSANPSQPITVKVNKASLFFIYDIKTKSILFFGRLADPR